MAIELSGARRRALQKIAEAGSNGTRLRRAELTTTFWLAQMRLVEGFRREGFLSTQYRITESGHRALLKEQTS